MALTADEVTRALSEWIASVSPDTPIAVRSSADWTPHNGIALRLLSARPIPGPRGRRQVQSVRLDYLITASLDDILLEHRCLGELVFAAFDRSDFQVVSEEDAAVLRHNFGVPAAVGFLVSANLQRQKHQEPAPPVREPLVVKSAAIARFEGIVLGGKDIPLVDVLVELPALNQSALTDSDGRFRLSGPLIPGQPTNLIATKNNTRVGVAVQDDRPLTIRIPSET